MPSMSTKLPFPPPYSTVSNKFLRSKAVSFLLKGLLFHQTRINWIYFRPANQLMQNIANGLCINWCTESVMDDFGKFYRRCSRIFIDFSYYLTLISEWQPMKTSSSGCIFRRIPFRTIFNNRLHCSSWLSCDFYYFCVAFALTAQLEYQLAYFHQSFLGFLWDIHRWSNFLPDLNSKTKLKIFVVCSA